MANASTSTKIGHSLAKALGIKLEYRDETGARNLTRGESVFSVGTADTYVEEEPTAAEWLKSITPRGKDVKHYVSSLFPFTHWILNYNVQWLIGDLVAGKYRRPSYAVLN
jgi:sodium-independent sulfate anion transporter 11